LGLEELLDDARFADTAARAANREELHDRLVARIGSLDLAELRRRLAAEDTVSAALASPTEVVRDEQVLANGYFAQHPTRPSVRLACAPMQFGDDMTEIRRPAPGTGEHTDEILAELGYDGPAVTALRDAGAVA
jgi:crotonobetainyl-CoA:carnitine CoA-transferase CaiB-like acyl-CoA transferase